MTRCCTRSSSCSVLCTSSTRSSACMSCHTCTLPATALFMHPRASGKFRIRGSGHPGAQPQHPPSAATRWYPCSDQAMAATPFAMGSPILGPWEDPCIGLRETGPGVGLAGKGEDAHAALPDGAD